MLYKSVDGYAEYYNTSASFVKKYSEIPIPETFENLTFWYSVFKWFGFQKVKLYLCSCSFNPGHLKTYQ